MNTKKKIEALLDLGDTMAMELPCVVKECVSATLQFHINTVHLAAQPQPLTAPSHGQRPQAERVKRPILSFTGQTLEQEEFDHFRYQFELYKDRLGGAQDGALLLRECLVMNVSRTIFSSHGNGIQNLSEEQLLLSISTCCVTKQTLQARVSELYKIKQDSRQTVQSFLAALKMKARQFDMKVKCMKTECEGRLTIARRL